MFRMLYNGANGAGGGGGAFPYCNGGDARGGSRRFTAAEQAALQRLFERRHELIMDGPATDVKSEVGYAACANFVAAVDETAQLLHAEIAPRAYRSQFTANYRALFPDGNRHYRVDVLEASVDQQFDIWVNGEKFELSPEAIALADVLQCTWVHLIETLDQWPLSAELRPGRAAFVSALQDLDAAWAGFEGCYIGELIAIEEKARQLVVAAADLEAQLPTSERPGNTAGDLSPASAAAEDKLLKRVARLNSIANYKRKGRDDLGSDILRSARAVMRQLQKQGGGDDDAGKQAARVLAGDVIASYTALRSYLRKVKDRIQHVDPHLCNNVGLVERLVDYEETWEVGANYVRDASMLEAVCDLVSLIRSAERVAPELTAMIEDCDVELFMVLPRLAVLGFLARPCAARASLFRRLLPHRFGADPAPAAPPPPAAAVATPGGALGSRSAWSLSRCAFFTDFSSPESPSACDDCAAGTVSASVLGACGGPQGGRRGAGEGAWSEADAELRRLRAQLEAVLAQPEDDGGAGGWEVLVRQAVLGEEAAAATPCASPSASSPAAKTSRGALLRQAEKLSLELQRHCPEDWNQCSAVLVHCLTGGTQRAPAGKFVV